MESKGMIMKLRFASGLAFALSAPAFAAPEDPVRKLLDAASHNFSRGQTDIQDYFSPERLKTLYSKDFVARYTEANERAKQNDEGPLSKDMIIGSHIGGCTFEDVKLDAQPSKDGLTEIHATFLPYTCMEGDPIQDEMRTVTFIVKTEDGRDVIDDIIQTWSTKYQFDRYPL